MIDDDMELIVEALDEAEDQDTGDEPAADAPRVRKSAAELLVGLAQDRYRFGCTVEGEPYAIAKSGGHVVRTLRGGQVSLRAELSSAYRDKHGRVAAQQALADALLVLEGNAQQADPEEVHLRVAETAQGHVWLDLGDKAERVVELTGAGWRLVEDAVPVRFRRTKLTGALPVPVPGGSLDELWSLLNVAPEDRPLLLAWLVAALVRPGIPHPILALFGEQGTGKSFASRLLVSLLDPSPVPLRKPPRDAEGWVTAAAGSWVVGLDNLSEVRDWFSDSLCRAATGEGDVRRALYTDGGLAVFAFRRCILLNGIDIGSLRGDLADRAIVVNLDRLAEVERRTEADLVAGWREAHPRILGALLTEGCEVLRTLPSLRLGSSPRMADFALVLAALDELHGTTGLDRYTGQARTLAVDTLDADSFLVAMRATVTEEFTGTAAELLALVEHATPEGQRRPADWPKGARQVTSTLKRNAPALRKARWSVDDLGVDSDARVLAWRISPPEIARIPSSQPSQPSEPSPATEEPRIPRNPNGQSQDDSTAVCANCGDPLSVADQLAGTGLCGMCELEASRC